MVGLCVFVLGALLLYISGPISYGFGTTSTRSLLRFASLAVISTASKHLHNDLAKAIKALEQKKNSTIVLYSFESP